MAIETAARPDDELADAVEAAVGARGVAWRIPHAGQSGARRFVVTLSDGRSVFVKAAVDDQTERWLQTERVAISAAGDLAPEIIAVTEASGHAVMVMESLHDASWPAGVFEAPGTGDQPVVWRSGQLERLFAALDRLAELPPPGVLPPLEAEFRPEWATISDAPDRFHDLGLAEPGWLESCLPQLVAAEKALELCGTTFVHNDVRSDNVCFVGDRVVLVDWTAASRGAAGFDLANLLQSAALEGGPDPRDVLPDAAPFAAWRAGQLINRAAGPAPDWLRRVFARMALIDLHWAGASLGLPLAPLRPWRSFSVAAPSGQRLE